MSTPYEFGRLRSFFWPVHRSELGKFLPMLVMFFLIVFNYNVLRATKDALIVTAPSSGAEAIPFIKVWAILPAAFLMTYLFTRVSNHLSREKVFYTMMGIFLLFFFLFAFFLYPFRDALHPHELADKLQDMLPVGCRGLIAVFRNWAFTLFYVMSEMWSTTIMTVLIWGFANDITPLKNAKRFYGLFGIGVNFSGVVAGEVVTRLSSYSYNPSLPFGEDGWGQSIIFLNSIVILSGLICLGLFRWMHVRGYGYSVQKDATTGATIKAPKMGIRSSFAYLAKSKYLLYIALIILTYNISINLVEVVWKDQVKALYPNPSDFNAYMGSIVKWIGVLATITSFCVSGNVIRRFGWSGSAMIPPLILLITGISFFSFLLFGNSWLGALAMFFGSSPLVIAVACGSLQNCLARASKYTLFDATKELAFVPLSNECKLKGKAAIDGVGSRLGKSGGAVVHQGLLMIFGTVSASIPYVALILLMAIGGWMFAVRNLGRKFQALVAVEETLAIQEEAPLPASKEPLPST